MSTNALSYAVAAAVIGGIYIYTAKRHLNDHNPAVVTVGIHVCSLFCYLIIAGATLPESMRADPVSVAPRAWVLMVAAVVVGALGALFFFSALDGAEASYVAPLSKTVPLFVLPLELGLLGADLTSTDLGGVLAVAIALYIVNYEESLLAPIVRLRTYRPAHLALGSAAAYGAFDISQRVILQEFAVAPMTWVIVNRAGIALVLLPLAVRPAIVGQDQITSDLFWFLIAGALNAFLVYFGVLAFAGLPASIASTVVNAQSIVAVLLGAALLGDRAFGRRLAGACLAVAGIGAIAFG